MRVELPPWLEQYRARLDKTLMHHAYLLSGRSGLGKYILGKELCLQTLCHSDLNNLCGECHSCKLSDLDNHPDFYELKILPDKKLIGIGQIHQLRHKLYESSFLGKNKAILIPNLEVISLDGLNAFLKILEEPPQNTFFFLITHFLNQVPMTIQSRCFDMKIQPPKLNQSIEWLNDFSKEDSLSALKFSNYLPFAAKEFLERNYLSVRKDFIEEISGIIKDGRDITNTSEKWLKEDESLSIKLEWMSQILMDSIKFNANSLIEVLNEDTDNITKYLGKNSKINNLHELLSQTNQLWNTFSQETNLRKDYQLNSLFINWERDLGISKKV